jgi:hypothetical protein
MDLNKTLSANGYAIVAAESPEQAANALNRLASAHLLRGDDVWVVDGERNGNFDHLTDEGARVVGGAPAAMKLLDEANKTILHRRNASGFEPWETADPDTRPARLLVFIDAYEALTRSLVGRKLRLAEKATQISTSGAETGVFLVGFMRTIGTDEVIAVN